MTKQRYLTDYIIEDLAEKMVFVGGPRQVGKTTLANKLVAAKFKNPAYFNWDNRSDRRRIISSDWPGNSELLILDEIHKYNRWKTLIKGEYDKLKEKYRFLVTGSTRLDVYRKGGDSLQGRYHYYRIHPFSLAEIINRKNKIEVFSELKISPTASHPEFEILDNFGGFPEPVIKQSEKLLRRWHNEKNNRLFREDIRDLEPLRNIAGMTLLSDLLPLKVGSLFSINSIREDMEVSHKAVSNWINILESFYYCFRIYPYTGKTIRSLKKEPKLYLWDWSEIDNESARFENMIASHLLKLIHFLYDYEGYRAKLYFLRDVDKRELDFLVTVDEKPWFAVEAKLSGLNVSRNISYFKSRLNIPYTYQIIKKEGIDRYREGTRIVSADAFLSGLI